MCSLGRSMPPSLLRPSRGRWASLSLAIGKLLSGEASLKGAWSLASYTFGKVAGEQQPGKCGQHDLDLAEVNSAILSNKFWAYTHLPD